MSWQLSWVWLLRLLHITAAMIAVGAPFFVRFVLLPGAAGALDEPAREKLRLAINARWRRVVHVMILIFLATGLYNFLVETRVDDLLITARWKDFGPDDQRVYHMLLGIKMLAALVLFFLASVLTGQSPTFAPVRRNASLWLTILLLLAALIVACSTLMRFLPTRVA